MTAVNNVLPLEGHAVLILAHLSFCDHTVSGHASSTFKFKQLLLNHLVKVNETWQACSLHDTLPKFHAKLLLLWQQEWKTGKNLLVLYKLVHISEIWCIALSSEPNLFELHPEGHFYLDYSNFVSGVIFGFTLGPDVLLRLTIKV